MWGWDGEKGGEGGGGGCGGLNTASALVREVQAAGGRIAAIGSRLKLSAPAPLPDGLVNELRAHKAEVLSFLQGQASLRWGAETAALVAWFLETPPPSAPFDLFQGVTVIHPVHFWKSIEADIAAGPGKARAFTGAFQKDLRRLALWFGGPARQGER